MNFNYDLTKWDINDLVTLLQFSGYGSDDLLSAKYSGTNNSGDVVFDITFEDLEGEILSGKVFVCIKNGKLTAEF
jgi:hypothetical protein